MVFSRKVSFQILVFLVSFLSFAVNHSTRKAISSIKYELNKDWGLDSVFLGSLDSIFMGSYAVGLIISGPLGDRLKPSWMIAIGSILSGICFGFFGLAKLLKIHDPIYFAALTVVNGLAQSTNWPNGVAIIGKWFQRSLRGTVFGFWSGNSSTGNIIGALFSGWVLAYLDWSYVMYVSAGLMISSAFLVLGLLPDSPVDVQVEVEDNIQEPGSSLHMKKKPISLWGALMIPGVLMYAISYTFSKWVNYTLFFWLPYYLQVEFNFGSDISSLLSSWFDFGGIIGVIFAGSFTDFLIRKYAIERCICIFILLILSMGALYIYYLYGHISLLANILLMITVGFFVGGPTNLISSAVSADLGTQPDIKGNPEAISTVAGLVDGIGSIGASVAQVIAAVVAQKFGWSMVFYLLILVSFISAILLLPLSYRSWTRRHLRINVYTRPEHFVVKEEN